MKTTGFYTTIIVCAVFGLIAPVYAGTPWLHVEGNKIKDPAGNVVVLRGIDLIDLGQLEDWQGGTLEMIDRLTDKADPQGASPGWYPKVFRLAVVPPDVSFGWPLRFGPPPADAHTYYRLLRPIVDYCKTKDVYVILDWHYVANTFEKVPQTNAFWEYMAPRFANDSHVLFELFNEPINEVGGDWIFNSVDDWLSVRQDMQPWVDLVRSHAPKNLILVAGAFYSQVIGPAATYPIVGENIVYVSHIYPGHFNDWWWADSFPAFGFSYSNEIITCAAVHPVIMTEWGFSQSNHPDSEDMLNGTVSEYGQPLMDFIESLGIGNTAWVASYDWGPPMFWDPGGWPKPPGPWTLRCGSGEMGCFVKDTLYARRNDNQPCDTSQFDIDVTPVSHDFGNVALGSSETLNVSISNIGCGPLTITGAAIDTDFAFVILPTTSVVVQPNETRQMQVAFTTTAIGQNSATLKINSDDADEPVVQVQLSATGVLVPPPPEDQIADILDFFDEAVDDGTLQGNGSGQSKNAHLKNFEKALNDVSKFIEAEKYQQACNKLRELILRCDGVNVPPDTVTGPAADELEDMIETLMQTLACG